MLKVEVPTYWLINKEIVNSLLVFCTHTLSLIISTYFYLSLILIFKKKQNQLTFL